MSLPHPIIIISYSDEVRSSLQSVLTTNGASTVACDSFCAAEELALTGLYNGMLVDLPSIIKSKGEEKIVAYTLANFFPTLRVRAMGNVLVPMAMPGSAKQDKSLNDFLNITCNAFSARKLRQHRRHPMCIASKLTYQGEESRSFTMNLSWGGVFVVDLFAERYTVGDEMTVCLPEFELSLPSTIRATSNWGTRRAPGIGLSFNSLDAEAEAVFSTLLKSQREFDRDRLVG